MKETDNEHTPQWFVEALASANVADSVQTRMRDAGRVAYAMARMRAERENVGFVPLPFAEYLEGLATMAGGPRGPLPASRPITTGTRDTQTGTTRKQDST